MNSETTPPSTDAPQKNNGGKPKKDNPFTELLINIVIPSVILITLSKEDYLGPQWGIVVALSFPILNGLKDLVIKRKVNLFSILGVVTVALTGGMSLLQVDPKYIAIKEAAIPPGLICIIALISLKTRYPLVKTFIYNKTLLNVDKISQILEEKDNTAAFQRCLRNGTLIVAGSFFVSAVLNYTLAKIILVSPPGTEAYNAELGKMLALSFPVNGLPSMLVLGYALFYTFRKILKLTDLKLEDIISEELLESDKKKQQQD